MRRLSTLSPKTTSTSGDDVNVNVNAQYNVNHLTVTPQLHLHLHLHLGIQFYLTAPHVTEFTVYVAHARARRERRALATAPGSGARAVVDRVDTRTGFELAQVRFAAAFRVTSSLLYFYFYICGLVFARLVALSRLFGPARRVAPVPHGRCGRCIPIWIRVAGESHCLRRPMPPHSCAAGALPRWSGRALLKRLRQARAQTVSRALLATGT